MKRVTSTCEVCVDQPELLSSYILRELQDTYNPDFTEDKADELEDLVIHDLNENNIDYDMEHMTDDAAKWLYMHGSF